MSNRLVNPDPQFFDNSGEPLNGGILRTYITTTSTPTPTYSNAALTISNGTYIVLDSAGRSPVDIFLDPAVTLKVTLETSAGVVLWTRDPVVDLAANINASVQVYAGNPNTHVAGNAGTPGSTGASMVYDITNGILYICTTTGNAASAVWTAVSNSFTGNEDIYTATQTLTAANVGRVATANSASAITFNLTAAATIGAGKIQSVKNIGVGLLTIDPAGGELIEGQTTMQIPFNQGAVLFCTGSAWRVIANFISNTNLDFQQFTTTGTWTKPSVPTNAITFMEVWAPGAGGGANATGGAGGGGGYNYKILPTSMLGATETVTVPAGGAISTSGGTTTFGSWLSAFGGGAGQNAANGGGGGGGGQNRAGVAGAGNAGGNGGAILGGAGGGGAGGSALLGGGGGSGGGASSGAKAGDGYFGGGGGGAGASSIGGGDSMYGGGGGGSAAGSAGQSTYAGNGGADAVAGSAPAGGGGRNAAGGRGEARIWTFW